MPKVKYGDVVRLHYTGCRSDGSIFAGPKGNPPVQARLGDADLIPGLEANHSLAGETLTFDIHLVQFGSLP
jgi:FKBP-type peptidyl-prolyl cis-trans isomerase 2